MKKIIFGGIAIVAIAVAIAISVHTTDYGLSDLSVANVEALADIPNPKCPNGCLDQPGQCYCYGEHPYKEAQW